MNSKTKFFCLLLLAVSAFSLSSANGEDPFGPSTPAGGGWAQSDWFGWYYNPYEPMVMHAQHGWIYAQKWGGWVWMWDYALGEWFSTSETIYPMVYDLLDKNWLWYYEGSANPRWYVNVDSGNLYTEFHGALLPLEMVEMVNSAMDLSGSGGGGDEEPDLLSQAMGYVLLALIGDPATMVCPTISRSPEVIDIMTLPPTVEISLDFGSGCIPEDTETTMAGSLTILVSNLAMTESGISADFALTADGLASDGVPILDGELVGSLSVGLSEYTTTFEVSLSINDLSSMDSSVTGQIYVNGSTTVDDEDEMVAAAVNATVSNLVVDNQLAMSGTFALSMDTNSVDVDMTFNSLLGSGSLSLTAIPSDTAGYRIRTTTPGSLMGYTLEINDVVMDPTICESMPVSGSIVIGLDGVHYSVIFTGDCEEGFLIKKF